jgi:diguanylate cyclase
MSDLSNQQHLRHAAAPKAQTTHTAQPRGAPILVVSTDAALSAQVLGYLHSAGYSNTLVVNDATQALEAAQRHQPTLLLLDLFSGSVPGTAPSLDLLQALRHRQGLQAMPVIVLTAANDPATKLRALDLGAAEFLAKPVDYSELILRVRNSLVVKAYQARLQHGHIGGDVGTSTGLPDQPTFMNQMHRSVLDAAAGHGSSALLHIHIQGLPSDAASGHVLSRVVRRLKGCLRRDDDTRRASHLNTAVVHQLSQDRFALLMPAIQSPDDAARVARRVLQALSRPLTSRDDRPTPHIGIALAPHDGSDAEMLLAHAQQAAALAPSTYRFFGPAFDHVDAERRRLESHLRGALARGEMHVAYQPKVDRITGRVVAAEALLRWHSPELGDVGPDRFVPVAEDNGLIVSLGAWVLQEACAQLKAWHEQGLTHLRVALNVSPQELYSGAVLDQVSQALERFVLPRGALVLELSESMLIPAEGEFDDQAVRGQLQALRALGVAISIDDFGTGASSLHDLKNFPLDELKIDRSLVMGLPLDKTDLAIVRAMVVLGHNLGLRVVAEGIETPDQLALLGSLGVDQYQGYWLGKPVAADEFARLAARFTLHAAGAPRLA